MIVETLLIPTLNNVAGKLPESGLDKLRSSHDMKSMSIGQLVALGF